jgi:transglutaminase-like putative cysteine protease
MSTAQNSDFLSLDHSDIAAVDLLDPGSVDWPRVERTAFLVHQQLRYEYPGTVRDLRHRLMIIAPHEYGDQRRILHRLDVECAAPSTTASSEDGFGNLAFEVRVDSVPRVIAFEAWMVLERRPGFGPVRLPEGALTDQRYTGSTRLTQPDAALEAASRRHLESGARGLALAGRLNQWVQETMRYAHDVTTVSTTAAEAFSLGSGVCQDYAHVMLAMCRLCGLPARYVSGHLLGEGGTHAWVEVLIDGGEGDVVAHALDPTHGVDAGPRHLTVAVGRDYADVAPTSGTFTASYPGELWSTKRVGVVQVDYTR